MGVFFFEARAGNEVFVRLGLRLVCSLSQAGRPCPAVSAKGIPRGPLRMGQSTICKKAAALARAERVASAPCLVGKQISLPDIPRLQQRHGSEDTVSKTKKARESLRLSPCRCTLLRMVVRITFMAKKTPSFFRFPSARLYSAKTGSDSCREEKEHGRLTMAAERALIDLQCTFCHGYVVFVRSWREFSTLFSLVLETTLGIDCVHQLYAPHVSSQTMHREA